MQEDLAAVFQQKTVKKVFNQRSDFIIIGLTGATGNGVSRVAEILANDFEGINLREEPSRDKDAIERLEYKNIYQFAKYNWNRFDVIKVRDIIFTYILENMNTYQYFQQDIGCDILASSEFQSRCYLGLEDQMEKFQNPYVDKESVQKEIELFIKGYSKKGLYKELLAKNQELEEYIHVLRNRKGGENNIRKSLSLYVYTRYILPVVGKTIRQTLDQRKYTTLFQKYGNEIRFFGTLDKTKWADRIRNVESMSNFDYFYSIAKRINTFIKIRRAPSTDKKSVPVQIVIDSLKNPYEFSFLKDRYSAYYTFALSNQKNNTQSEDSMYIEEHYNALYENPTLVEKNFERFITILIEQVRRENTLVSLPVAEYIQSLSSADDLLQYLLKQMDNIANRNMNQEELIQEINEIEYSEEYARFGILEDEYKFFFSILRDPIRTFCMLAGLSSFYLQDIQSAIQNADIFLSDTEESYESSELKYQVVKYVSLIMHPGLVPPTKIERCMQIAFSAKLNSGCISRQVGAVVTDKDYNILSTGWNDVPVNRVPCVYRNLKDLKNNPEAEIYSDLERGASQLFRRHIEKYDFTDRSKVDCICEGVPLTYCFKSQYSKVTHERAQENTRAMHAEARAFLACDNKSKAEGGCLFTTSSSCERCTIVANECKIKKIYYIEQYPGISQTHVNASGKEEGRAKFLLFQGAIGVAYTKLYTPIIPIKDELQLRGIDNFRRR